VYLPVHRRALYSIWGTLMRNKATRIEWDALETSAEVEFHSSSCVWSQYVRSARENAEYLMSMVLPARSMPRYNRQPRNWPSGLRRTTELTPNEAAIVLEPPFNMRSPNSSTRKSMSLPKLERQR